MKKLFLLSLFCILTKNCYHPLTTVTLIDLTFDDGWSNSYSIKIIGKDLAFWKTGRLNCKYYKTTLTDSFYRIICNQVALVQSNKELKSNYEKIGEDLPEYKLVYNTSNSLDKSIISVRSTNDEPKMISDLKNSLLALCKIENSTHIDSIIEFESLKNFYPPLVHGMY